MELVVIDGDGSEREIRVERGREGFEIVVDGETFIVDHVAADGSHRSLLIGGRQHEVAVQHEKEGRYRVSTSRGEETFVVRDPLDHLLQTVSGSSVVNGPSKVLALMPGRVVSLLASEGEAVDEGQGILVVEAMKMENEIRTELSGTLKFIFVEADQPVDSGDPLFEIEPEVSSS